MVAKSIRTTGTAVLLGALIVPSYGCDSPLAVMGFSGATMGTTYNVLVETGVRAEDSVALGAVIEGELADVNRVMSTYDSGSDVSRFGRYSGTEPFPVDPTLLEVLEVALEVCERSSSAFDPTVAPLVDAWGFGPEDVLPPDSTRVASLRVLVGCDGLSVDTGSGTLAKSLRETRIDLSGIAKGFAAERIGRALRELGYENALVDVGGELRAVGTHRDGRPWRVALEGPGQAEPGPIGTIDLIDEAVATSGDFRNYYEYLGELYAHIIDPRTGFPVRYRGFSVSVVHPDATFADAWATALTVLGPEEGFELAEREDVAALFAWRSGAGVESRATTALAGRVTPVE
jgi:thiamine biosynthesis lipoprotein